MKASLPLCLFAFLIGTQILASGIMADSTDGNADLAACLGNDELAKVKNCLPAIEKCSEAKDMFTCMSVKTCLDNEGIDDQRLLNCAIQFLNAN